MQRFIAKYTYLLLFIFIGLVQANVLLNEFAFDDYPAILENAYIHNGVDGIPEAVQHPYWHGLRAFKIDIDENYIHYRPVVQVLHALQYELFGTKAVGYHFVSIALFLTLLFLIKKALEGIGISKNIVVIALLLFGVSPIHTEVIANIKSQDELLASIELFGTLLMFGGWLQKGWWWQLVASLLFFALAVFTKESSITCIAIMAILIWFKTPKSKSAWLSLLVFGGIIGGMVLVRAQILPASPNLSNVYLTQLGWLERLPSAIHILTLYVLKTLIPWPLLHSYDGFQIAQMSWRDPIVYVELVGWISVSVLTILGLLRRKIWAFALAFFLATISLASHIVVPISIPFAERLAFLPSLGIYTMLSLGINHDKIQQHRRLIVVFISASVLAMSAATFVRNAQWKNNITLFEADLNKAQDNFIPASNLAYAYFDEGKVSSDVQIRSKWFNKAGALLDLAYEQGGDKFDFLLRRGIIHYELQQYEASVSKIQEALTKIDMPSGHYYLGRTLIAMGNLEAGEQEIDMLVKQEHLLSDDEISKQYYQLGRQHVAKGNYDRGLRNYNKALQRVKCLNDIHLSMGLIANEQGRMEDAIASFQEDITCRGNNSPAGNFLKILEGKD